MWSSGEQLNLIADKPRGTYSVTVSDAAGRTLMRTYAIGYKVNWINQTGVSNTDGKLTKTSTVQSWSAAGAISSNLLPANTDGWIEFVGVNGANYRIGLAANNRLNYNEFTNSIFIDNDAGSAVVFEGGGSASLGTLQTGDIFRISREGSNVKYYRNGIVLRTVAVNASLELKVKACFFVTGSNAPTVATSFDSWLVVHGNVIGTEGVNGTGSIALSVTGGLPPYTFNWSSGEQTNFIGDKLQGAYTVTVEDALGRTLTRTYSIGYKANWINQVGVSNNDGKLTKTAQDQAWSAGAISSNLLPANTNGWMEFVGINGANYRVGLAVNNRINYAEFSGSLFIDHTTGTDIAFEGGGSNSLGTFQTGDVFRIEREGSLIKYYRNGVLLRSVSVSPALELKMKASLSVSGSNTPYIISSFESQLVVFGNVVGLEGNQGSGSVSLSVSGGTAPYSYSWLSGEQTSSIIDKPRGTYTVTVTDVLNRMTTRTYAIGYKANWVGTVGVNNNAGRLTKTVQDGAWNSGAVSSNLLPANKDGWIEFVGVNGANYRMGLASNDFMGYQHFTNSIFVDNATGTAVVFEGGGSFNLGAFQTGDVFRISREGNQVKYSKNGTILRTVTVNPSLTLKIKACLSVTGSNTPYVNSSFWLSDGIVRTYYSISDGNWTSPATWSLTENGPPSTVYPDDIDKVVIKKHEVSVTGDVKSAGITITASNDNTRLKIDGNIALLTVKGNIIMNSENNSNTAEVLLVQNNGRLEVK
jgi:hypothetical protein